MDFSPLTADHAAELDADRAFVPAVLEACFPNEHLIGTAADLEILQQVLDGGPFTESPEDELVALRTSLGDLLGQTLEMDWVCFTDERGSTLGMRYGQTSIVLSPRDMIIKRVERGEEVIELQTIYDGIVEAVSRMIASGEYR